MMQCLITIYLITVLCITCGRIGSTDAAAREVQTLRTKEVEVWFDTPLDIPAKDVADIFPEVRKELERIFEWEFYHTPKVFLVRQREDFLLMTDNPITVAFAAPERNLIVIDHSKASTLPFSMENTLKHELCHILLHQHIASELLPRWLDEGLCQWASNSIDEIIHTQKQSALNGATLSRQEISLADLRYRFPDDIKPRLLAYEASKRFTIYLIEKYGKNKIVDILKHLEIRQDIETSTLNVLSKPLNTLEKQWRHTLRQKAIWLTFTSHYLYEILFAIMALLSFYGFIKLRIRKNRYRDEEEEIDRTI